MSREPVVLYLFRVFVGMALLTLVGLHYWSSQLQEKEIKALRGDLHALAQETVIARQELMAQLAQASVVREVRPALESLADPSLPNLLVPDRYMDEVLPDQLGADFQVEGTLSLAFIGKPKDLLPYSSWYPVSDLRAMCTPHVAKLTFGRYESYSPDLAYKIERRDTPAGPEYWIHLRRDVYWEPLNKEMFPDGFALDAHFFRRHCVTAHDFKFWFDGFSNPHVQEGRAAALRTLYADVEEVRVLDDYTFAVRWRRVPTSLPNGEVVAQERYIAKELTATMQPLARWVYQYFADGTKIIEDDEAEDTYRTNSIFAQNLAHHWARYVIPSCGQWIFEKLKGRNLTMRRNPQYYDSRAVLTERLDIVFRDSPDQVWQDFKAGNIDFFDSTIAPDKLSELGPFMHSEIYRRQELQGASIRRLDYLERQFRFIAWNMASPLFESRAVRQALTMAIDRRRIIDQLLSTRGVALSGPLYPEDESYDHSIQPRPYDPEEARRILESEGWYDHDGDGILDKIVDGKRKSFSFTLIYYHGSTLMRTIADYLHTMLREVGIDCRPLGVDITELAEATDGKEFDAVMIGWRLGAPPEEPSTLWHSCGAKVKGSHNFTGFAHPEADEILNHLNYEHDPACRQMLYHRLHQILHEECPYTCLFVPKTSMLYRGYVKNLFIPKQRQDLIPGADVSQPLSTACWIDKQD